MGAMRDLNSDELRKLLNAFRGPTAARNRALLTLGIQTGFRVSEILSLDTDQVLGRDKFTVERRRMKGRCRSVTKPIPPQSRAAIEECLRSYPGPRVAKGRPLFQTPSGDRLSRHGAYAAILRAGKAAGIDLSGLGTHSMRKTYATRAYGAFVARLAAGERLEPMRMVQNALGHASIASTEAYLRPPEGVAFELLEALEGMFDEDA
jgi:integrase